MVCYEFGPSFRDRLAHWLSEVFAGTIMRWPAGCTNRAGRVVDPTGALATFDASARVRVVSERKPGLDLSDEGGRCGSDRIVTSEPCGAAERRRAMACFPG